MWSKLACGFVAFEVLVRGMDPKSTSKVYLPHLKSYFALEFEDFGLKTVCETMKFRYMCRGLERVHREMHPEGKERKLAFTLSMINHSTSVLRKMSLEAPTACERKAEQLAMKTGLFCLLRKSEFLPVRTKHGIRRDQVAFTDELGSIIPHEQLKRGSAHGVTVKVQFSKTDWKGRSKVLSHRRQPVGTCCIVSELEDFLLEIREIDPNGDFLWVVNGKRLLSDTRIASIMKATATDLGIPKKLISAHSLRYAGASILATAGIPQYLIEYYGGWATGSKALKGYLRLGTQTIDTVSQTISISANTAIETDLANVQVQLM
jgi:Phage integrase family